MKENNTCCICGLPYREEPYELKDASICPHCAEKMRFHYPLQYWGNANPLKKRRPDLSHVLPDSGLKSREKADMIDELRQFPLNKPDPFPKFSYTLDPMRRLTLKEFQADLAQADLLRQKLMAQYQEYDNIFSIQSVTCEKQLLVLEDPDPACCKFRHQVSVSGTMLLGSFHPGDFVTLIHGDIAVEADVLSVSQKKRWTQREILQGKYREEFLHMAAVEGHPADLTISLPAPQIEAGDFLAMDD